MLFHSLLLLGAFFLPQSAAQTSPPQPAPPAPVVQANVEPSVMARLWVVAFDTTVPADALPLDPRQAAHAYPDAIRPARDSNGRISTLGLASQEQISKFEIECRGHRLSMKNGTLTTEGPKNADGKNAEKSPWNIIASPAIQVLLNQPAMIKVGQPVVYLEKRPDGLFEAKSSNESVEGVSIELTASKLEPKGIRFTGVNMKVHRVAERAPIDGLDLPVGKPRIDTRETSLDLTLDEGNLAIIPLPQAETDPAILVFLTAQRVVPSR